MQFTPNFKISRVKAVIPQANNTDTTTDVLDMQGWDGVVFITPVAFCATGAVITVKAQGSVNSNGSSATDITGAVAAKTSANTNDVDLLVVDVYRPLKRYVLASIANTTQNVTFGPTIAIQYKGSKAPIAQSTTITTLAAVVGS